MLEILFFFICSVIIGALFLFFGYAFFRILLPIWGLLAGLSFGINGMQSLFGGPGIISITTGLLVGLVLGVGLALLAWYMYEFAVYVFGFTVGYVIGSGFMMALGLSEGFVTVIFGIVFAIALMVLFSVAKMPQLLVVFVTAAGGAMAIVMGIFVLFGQVPEFAATMRLTGYMIFSSWFWIIIWAVLTAIGMAWQSAMANMSGDLSAKKLTK